MDQNKPLSLDSDFIGRLHSTLQQNGQVGDGDQIAVFAPPNSNGHVAVQTYHPSQAFDE